MRHWSVLLALAGLALGTLVIGWFGAAQVFACVLSVGWSGIGLLLLWQLLLVLVLALAWRALLPGRRVKLGVLAWGRLVRDAGSNCLPFSTIGGFVLGARAITVQGVPWSLAAGSTIVDVTTEFLAQLAFTLIGLLILLARAPDSRLTLPLFGVLLLAGAAVAVFIWFQRGGVALLRALGERIAGERLTQARPQVEALQDALAALYGRSDRLALGAGLHLLGWLGTAIGSWLAYHLLGAPIDLPAALAIEALLHMALTAGFVMPGSLGVQEAAYAGLGAVFGLPADISLAVSLLRRARDASLGVPVLLLWQGLEMRRATRHAPADAAR